MNFSILKTAWKDLFLKKLSIAIASNVQTKTANISRRSKSLCGVKELLRVNRIITTSEYCMVICILIRFSSMWDNPSGQTWDSRLLEKGISACRGCFDTTSGHSSAFEHMPCLYRKLASCWFWTITFADCSNWHLYTFHLGLLKGCASVFSTYSSKLTSPGPENIR